ncbi:ABC transporter permease [Saccharothrix obliqua]|uniref:ABC transporter permease n=1 Tax=Saccharothrix obliqua TaxID=2861747 RepID=UPI001C604CE7|nr:ABC transporter permease [Saccharothrix obliqua]MBW4716205.1 ABC transporter permease [Saccharothrix obliqua]
MTTAIRRDRVGWPDLLWLTWRQHRWQLLTVGGGAVLGSLVWLALAWLINSTGTTDHGFWFIGGLRGPSQLIAELPAAGAAVIAVFWAAPLLSREYEQQTHLLVWSQDLPPTRWLLGKVVLLGVPAVGLSAGFGAAVLVLLDAVNEAMPQVPGRGYYVPFSPFSSLSFEAAPLVQVGYAAFGFALGLAFSALTRRTVLSMGLTLGAFVTVRFLVGNVWRPHFMTPVRTYEMYEPRFRDPTVVDDQRVGSMHIRGGYADAAGREVPFPSVCSDGYRGGDEDNYIKCVTDHGVVQYFTDFHPADRVVPFQLIEFGVFAVLAAGLLAVAFTRVRRR